MGSIRSFSIKGENAISTTTTRLGLPRPVSTDNVTLANQQALIDAIDNTAAKIGHSHDGTSDNGPQITAAGLANGAATDAIVGTRTISDEITPVIGAATITNLLGMLGNVIKSITGQANWYTLPAMSIAAIISALGFKAPLASPAFTGNPTAPTASAGTNTTQVATTAFVEATRATLAAADALKAPSASPVFTGVVTIPTLGAEMDAGAHTIGFTEFDNGVSGAAKTINFKVSNKQKLSVSANTVLTFTAPTKPCSLTLKLTYAGAFTVTLPAHKKPNGVALAFTSVNSAVDILSIYWDGTNYYVSNSTNWS